MFVSERVTVELEDARADGTPATPSRVIWGDETFEVAGVIETWKTYGEAQRGKRARYLRRHFYKLRAADGRMLTVYCERGSPAWYLYSLERE